MGKNKNGIMGPASGKVGVVVSYKWKGKEVLRGYTPQMTNPQTPAQQLHRAKFKAISLLAHDLLPVLKRGFSQMADKASSTETGLFIKHNWSAIAAPGLEGISIPPDRVVVSKGELPGVTFGAPQMETGGAQPTVSVAFTTDASDGTTGDDYVYLGLYCPACGMSVLSAPSKRQEQRVQMSIPAAMQGKEVHLYGFAVGSDFNTIHRLEASDSCYLGSVIL